MKPTLTFYYIKETNPILRFFTPIKQVGLLCHLASPVSHLLGRNKACLMMWDPWRGWQVTTSLNEYRKRNKGEDHKTLSSELSDEEFIEKWSEIFNRTSFDGTTLTPERVIARLLGNPVPWKKATWYSLGIL